MKGTSKVIMGATLVMVVTLAIVLGLILVLLAELYCSLLLRRRKLRNSNTIPTTVAAVTTAAAPSPSHPPQHSPPPPPPRSRPFTTSFYAQGVLQAPRTLLFPSMELEPKKQQGIHVQTQESNVSTLGCIGLVSIPPSPLSSFISRAPQKPVHLDQGSQGDEEVACGGGGGEHLVYISNPIYENEEGEANTPFETPDTSPSRLERSDSSGDEEDDDADADADADETQAQTSSCAVHSPPNTPPLTPMKKLPAEGCSVSLKDARSLGTSCSDSRSVNGPSSSSSGSPCTSPSW